ncbi:uncharacterized protein PV09_06992 [Verruconis gallopava]|uniref:Uncharacterized protein n=1 Tax=Verruconis gallopava TaxID=253628 RepID=A0A0D2AQT7_9PEZI|nr:uncharacterized protein PV09_06992 [Verruconis gallopava]KIW01514.1 hypothetical protein PV09_06992 [Verruconis gallopava]
MRMKQLESNDDLGPRGFKLVRVFSPSSYDPVAGIEWRPPKDSDELFEALKKAFPTRKTHRERMCEALVQFLAAELGNASPESAADVPEKRKTVDKVKSATQSYQDSKRPLFRMHAPCLEQNGSGASAKKATSNHQAGKSSANGMDDVAAKKSKDWEDMTVVWKSDLGLTKGARPRRTMTEEERTDYRMRRVRGACVACKRKKRKCNHDPDPSPRSSLEAVGDSPKLLTPVSSQAEGSLRSTPRQSPDSPFRSSEQGISGASKSTEKIHEGSNKPDDGQKPGRVDEMFSTVGFPSRKSNNIVETTTNIRRTPSFIDLGNSVPSHREVSLYQYATLPGDEPQLCWDLSANELQMLDLQHHTGSTDFSSLPVDAGSNDTYGNGLSAYTWESNNSTSFDWALPFHANGKSWIDTIHHADLAPMHHVSNIQQCKNLDLGRAITTVDSIAHVKEHSLPANVNLLHSNHVPIPDELENHWAQHQAQIHVEQWLKQKMIEEHSTPLNPELEAPQLVEHTPASPKRRKVKFDFSSLIDGPPTLSPPPAEPWQLGEGLHGVEKQEHHEQLLESRPPRSTSRHSTGSRMSFSDIISLSSAMTSLSVKDTGSERNMDDEEENADEESFHGDVGSDAEQSADQDSSYGDELSEEDEDEWIRWIADPHKVTEGSKDDLFEKHVRIGIPKNP